jgi:hypothetical protein
MPRVIIPGSQIFFFFFFCESIEHEWRILFYQETMMLGPLDVEQIALENPGVDSFQKFFFLIGLIGHLGHIGGGRSTLTRRVSRAKL